MFLCKAKNDSDVVMVTQLRNNLDDIIQQNHHTANTRKNLNAS